MPLTPPEEQPYETQLTKRTSEQRRIWELLSNEELGDQTASQMLRKIQQLLGVGPSYKTWHPNGHHPASRTIFATPSAKTTPRVTRSGRTPEVG